MSTISAGTTSTTTLIHSGDTTGSLVLKTNDTGSGGTTAVTIDTSQNVGIGTSSPSNTLQVSGTSYTTGKTYIGNNTNFTNIGNLGWSPAFIVEDTNGQGIAAVRNTADAYGGSINLVKSRGTLASPSAVTSGDRLGQLYFNGYDSVDYSNTGASIEAIANATWTSNSCPTDLVFSTTTSGSFTASERMRIDSSGNVGIGTSTPAAKLHVNTTSAALFIGYGGNFDNYIQTNNLTLFTNYNGSVEYMRINSSGNVGIGLSPSYRLSVLDSAAGARVVDIQNTASTGNPIMQYSTMTVTGTTSNYFFVGRANASDRIYIYGSGNIVNVNNSYGALSDVKLKENITDATPKLADLMRVKVRNYNLIGETQKQIGVVAQELEQVFPSMVDETIDRDAEGNELETTTKSVKYSVFVPMLIKAIQEQQALIQQLQADVAALKGV